MRRPKNDHFMKKQVGIGAGGVSHGYMPMGNAFPVTRATFKLSSPPPMFVHTRAYVHGNVDQNIIQNSYQSIQPELKSAIIDSVKRNHDNTCRLFGFKDLKEDKIYNTVVKILNERKEKKIDPNGEKNEKPFLEVKLGYESRCGEIKDPVEDLNPELKELHGVLTTNKISTEESFFFRIEWCLISDPPLLDKMLYCVKGCYDHKSYGKEEKAKKKISILFRFRRKIGDSVGCGRQRLDFYYNGKRAHSHYFNIVKPQGLRLGVELDRFGHVKRNQKHFDGYTNVIIGTYFLNGIRNYMYGEEIICVQIKEIQQNKKRRIEKKFVVYADKDRHNYKSIQFTYVKPPKGFKEGEYLCEILRDDEIVHESHFSIGKRKPRLFLGNYLSKYGDVIDDTTFFGGACKCIKGIYRFCKLLPPENDVFVRILKIPEKHEKGKTKYKVWEKHYPNKKEFDRISFHMKFKTALHSLPGMYSCEVLLNGKIVGGKSFFVEPRYNLNIGNRLDQSMRIRKNEKNFPASGPMYGMIYTNSFFPRNTIHTIFIFVCEDVQSRRGKEFFKLIYLQKFRELQPFKRIIFTIKKQKKFPLGVYNVLWALHGQIVAIRKFSIISNKSYEVINKTKLVRRKYMIRNNKV